MDLCNQLCLSIRPAILLCKNLHVEYYAQTVQPDSFIRALNISITDLYCLIPLTVVLTLAGGHK